MMWIGTHSEKTTWDTPFTFDTASIAGIIWFSVSGLKAYLAAISRDFISHEYWILEHLMAGTGVALMRFLLLILMQGQT